VSNSSDRARSAIVAAGVVVSAACMWLASRNVQWSELGASLHTLHAGPLALAILLGIGAYVAMAYRWRILLGPLAPLPLHDVFDATMIGFLSGLIIPQRLGDLVKAGLLARKARSSATAVLATVAVERVTDVIMLLIVASVMLNAVAVPVVLSRALWLLAVAAAAAIVALWKGPELWHALVGRAPSLMQTRAGALVDRLIRTFSLGLTAAHHGPSLARALAAAALVWLLAGFGMTAFTRAFALNLPWYAGFLVMLLVNLGGILPSSPGGIGVYHYMTVLALGAWSTDRTSALAFAFVTHAIALVTIAVVGAMSLLRQGLTLQAVRNEAATTASALAATQ